MSKLGLSKGWNIVPSLTILEFTKLRITQPNEDELQPIFLAPTGALEEGILCVRASVRDIIQNNSENEF